MDFVKVFVDEEGYEVREFLNGFKEWRKNGLLHRDDDKPAVVCESQKEQRWFKNGKRHRDGDKPAEITIFSTSWCKNDQPHRDGDKPAVVRYNGTEEWHKNGLLHRENNKAFFAISSLNGTTYFLRGRSYLPKDYWVRLLLLEY